MTTHTENLEIRLLEVVRDYPNIKLYAVSPKSALQEFLPLSPKQSQNNFILEEKNENFINDILSIPNPLSPFSQTLKDCGIRENNFFVKFLIDFKDLINAIFIYIKSKK